MAAKGRRLVRKSKVATKGTKKAPVKPAAKKVSKAKKASIQKDEKPAKAVEDELDKDKIELGDDSAAEGSSDEDEEEEKGLSDIEQELQEEMESKNSKTTTTKKGVYKLTKPTAKGKSARNGQEQKKFGKRGVIYIGRIPHGFYEDELRKYFSQFGEITRLRLSRNRKTGNSKHYGFIEFSDPEVASIAAETMNNYLLFGHILKCAVIPPEKIHDELFNGANTKFTVVPWKELSEKKNDMPKTAEKWAELEKRADDHLKQKQEKLKEAGIDFDLSAL